MKSRVKWNEWMNAMLGWMNVGHMDNDKMPCVKWQVKMTWTPNDKGLKTFVLDNNTAMMQMKS